MVQITMIAIQRRLFELIGIHLVDLSQINATKCFIDIYFAQPRHHQEVTALYVLL